jgi:hypothetical protein
MNEPWLRGGQGWYLNAPQPQHVYGIKVENILLPNVKSWDTNKIFSLFPREVAHDIVTVPLFGLVTEDKLIWSEEKDGIYSVRSGYRKLMEANNKGYVCREEILVGVDYGKFKRLQKQSICYGDCVRSASQLDPASKAVMYNAL